MEFSTKFTNPCFWLVSCNKGGFPRKDRQEGFPIKTGYAIIISFLFLFAFWSPASSQVYQWKDKDGNIHFSDTPPAAGAGKEIKIRQGRESPGEKTEGARPSSRSLREKRPYGAIYVVLYMTDWCGYSKKAKEYLNSLGVNFFEYNVEKDIDKWREMMEKSGVPVIDV